MTWPTKKLGELIEGFFKSLVLLFVRKESKTPIEIDEIKLPKPTTDEVKETTIEVVEQILQFVKGTAYLVDNPNVKKLRELIGDEFGLGKSCDYLNCTEYVQFRVKQKLDIDIKWPQDRPRHGGLWASIFEKNNLYKILEEPQINCAASFASPTFNVPYGHVAFVEEVMPDGSIKVSEANWPKNGIYNERTIGKEKWQNTYGAKFIDFS